MRRRAWKTRGKRGSALNKGMPIYDQMSGWRVKAERQPCQNLGFFGPVGSAKALMRLRLSKNFLRPTKSKPALRVRVIRVAARKRKNDVWLVTNVLDPKRLPAELAARFYRMRWESECFFRTYKRVVKDVRLVSRTVPMVVREAEISLLACQLLLGQGALALKVGGKRAGRDELKCSAAEVLREIRRELDAARKPVPRSSFAKRLQQTGRDRRERTGPKMKREPPRRKKHVAPQPPRLKVLSAEQKRQIEDSNLKEAAA